MPDAAARMSPRVTQLHSHDCRSEAALPDGAVLIVGSGQTGVRLAEELAIAGDRCTRG
jgi:putative flavoprotein involved in K+ transport